MKKLFLALALAATLYTPKASAWGSWGHQHINNGAVFTLPKEMIPFFYNHIDFITEEAVVPDLRKYINGDKGEGGKHFIDMEPFPPVSGNWPYTYKEAAALFGDSLLRKTGTLPWQINDMMTRLTNAFKEKNKSEILYIAADLAHYIGDATQPLHTTENYDGQLTGQKGVHSFFESQLPEQFGSAYNFNSGEAQIIADPNKEIWSVILHSHALLDSVLSAEKEAEHSFPADKIYAKDANGQILKNRYGQQIHSHEFAKAYHDRLHRLIERQLRLAVKTTADFWYTAWVNAGKPNLNDFDPKKITERNQKNYQSDLKYWKKGKLVGFLSVSEIQ
ncbi:zinc dependent phospholipase C family protein [Taibaiella soli]|nr:zinc dependent phospholipase C family protein [Taibaiella soli]